MSPPDVACNVPVKEIGATETFACRLTEFLFHSQMQILPACLPDASRLASRPSRLVSPSGALSLAKSLRDNE